MDGFLKFIDEVDTDYIPYTSEVDPLADKAIATGVKDKDANHAACAIIGKCDYLLTVDKRFLNYKTNKLNIVNPIDFIAIWEEFNNV